MNQIKKLKLRLNECFMNYPQAHHFYDGPYHGGKSFYSYYLDEEGMRVFDGPFHYQLSCVSSYGSMFHNAAQGRFLNGLKNGVWHYYYKSGTHTMKLTVNYVKGSIDGKVYYEEIMTNMIERKSAKTKIAFHSSQRKPTGAVEGFMHGHKIKALLDAEGLPHDEWSSEIFDKEHGEWKVVELWNHGRLEKAERKLFTYGRKETIAPYMCQKLNELIDEINHTMLRIVQHGSQGGLSYIPCL